MSVEGAEGPTLIQIAGYPPSHLQGCEFINERGTSTIQAFRIGESVQKVSTYIAITYQQ
jgi:hypothetical protein